MQKHFLYTVEYIKDNRQKLKEKDTFGDLWTYFIKLHPADIADILILFSSIDIYYIFKDLTPSLQADTFMELSTDVRHTLFSQSNLEQRENLINNLTIDELADFFDDLSDEELHRYMRLVNKQRRSAVLSILQFSETSAAGIMDSNIFVLSESLTVQKTIELLQRLKPDKKLYRSIYIVNKENLLVGFIYLEDLVLKNSKNAIKQIMYDVDYKINANIDQEEIAKYMLKYHIDIAPVVDDDNRFLGVIASDTLAEIVEDEATEDIYRMASMTPIRETYFETSFSKLLVQRGGILCILLLLQSVSAFVINSYQNLLANFLITYMGLITSTGGNVSSQTSALVIQGLATGDLSVKEMGKFLRRECVFSVFLSLALSMVAFIRTYIFSGLLLESFIVGFSLFLLTIFSMIIGTLLPFILHKLKMDPAHSAGPLLATCMDILGVVVYCLISNALLP